MPAFFRPTSLTGVDLEGLRLYPNSDNRDDAVSGIIAGLPHTTFTAIERVDVITAWFPFVTPAPILAWRLPLTVFSPERLFARIVRNLTA